MKPKISFISTVTILASLLGSACVSAQQIGTNITLNHKFDPNPLVLEGRTGGKLKATEIVHTSETATGYCDGYVNRQPNYILVLRDFFDFLKIEVESNNDATILIQGPGGVWCNDDSETTNPVIEGQWQEGRYEIWIGTYQENSTDNYQVIITE